MKAQEYDVRGDIARERDYKVVKSNDIVQRARYDLNISELKTLAYIFSKIKPNDVVVGQWFSISIKDYCMVCGIDYKNGGNYKYIKDTLQKLRDKSFWITKDDGSHTTVGWLEKVNVSEKSGKIRVRLDEDLAQYLTQLYSNYTQYELLSTLPMRSSYSFRIYELLKSYAFQHSHEFDVDELKAQIAAENYVNFKDFRLRVIETAVKEINLYTDLEVSWYPIKKGRKVIKVHFDIKQRDTWGRAIASARATEALDGRQMELSEFGLK